MPNIVIGNTGDTENLLVSGQSIAPKQTASFPFGSYSVVALEGWNLANKGEIDLDPDILVNGIPVSPLQGEQFTFGEYSIEVAE